MRRVGSIVILALAAGCGGTNSDGGGGAPAFNQPPISGLRINEVSIYQGVKIPLAIDGNPVLDRVAPVVQARDALMRVFVQPEPGWQPREVIARVELLDSTGVVGSQEVRHFVGAGSAEADFESAFNFDIPAGRMTGDLGYSVGLYEVTKDALGPATPGFRFPAEGAVAMNAAYSGPSLKMVAVPVQYFADNSGRLPDLGEAQLEVYRRAMHDVYPTPKVEIRVREPMQWTQPINRTGQGWAQLLQSMLYFRQEDIKAGKASLDEYYFGFVNPADSLFGYCQQGCVLGLTFQVGQAGPGEEAYLRGSVGGGWPGDEAAQTFIHEIGHAHGRLHAPCAPGNQIQDVDPAFPHASGGIGSWGYSLSNRLLYDPQGKARDFMGYCEPTWVSDYTFRALFDKIAFVNGAQRFVSTGPTTRYRVVSIYGEEMALGAYFDVPGLPSGTPETVEVVDAKGKRRSVTGYFHPYDHLPGGMVLVPEPDNAARGLRLRGRNLAL